MSLYRRSISDIARSAAVALVNGAARLAEHAITAWPNTTDDQPPTAGLPEQRTRHTIRTACVKAAADDWQTTYPVLPEAWLQLTTEVDH